MKLIEINKYRLRLMRNIKFSTSFCVAFPNDMGNLTNDLSLYILNIKLNCY